ncbi:MAG: M20/M25/M40 family metallo-hydrolase [Thermoleophilia bacterium]|nr:M20/M25/M40 family metallo-hydrolase [Thermoleophilia bacterium]
MFRDATRALADLTGRLVAIESINPALVAGGSGEAAVAAFVANWLGEAGLETRLVESTPGRPSVVATARGTGGGRSLLLNGHLDTVGVEGMERPFALSERNGRLYGRGAGDMKGPVAALMLVAAAAVREGWRGDVILTAVADEEFASVGTEDVLHEVTADAAIVAEPTEEVVAVAHKGFVMFDLETEGRAAHGSRPDLGVDGIAAMGPVLTGIASLDRELRGRTAHPLLGTGSVHASLISGGQEYSTYPSRCLLGGERRTVPGESVADVRAELEALAMPAAARVTVGPHRDPFEGDPEAAVVRALLEASGSPLGGVAFWADSALIQAAGIPTVVYGPLVGGLHAEDEWVDLASLRRCYDAYLEAARTLCT